jgi:hypothetical protein
MRGRAAPITSSTPTAWSPGNPTFPSSFTVSKNTPHGTATLQQFSDKIEITPGCLSIGTMYLAKGLALAIICW